MPRRTKPTSTSTADASWLEAWLDSVRSGQSTMSQRRRVRLDAVPGGLTAVRRLAKAKGVHLVLLTDDEGVELVAASLRPFRVLC